MKAHYLIALFAIVISSCVKPQFYQQRINDIPLETPKFGVKIYFKGDALPKEPYFEVIDFDIFESGKLSKKQVRAKLEMAAIKEGVDAIVEVDAWKESEDEVNFFTILIDVLDDDGETTTVTTHNTHITGRGIIFLENLDKIDAKKEYEYFYVIDQESGFPKPFFKIEYKLTGQEHMVYPESDEALDIYKKYFQFYSDFHLIEQRESWLYKKQDGKVSKRILLKENGVIEKICLIKYDEKDRVKQLKIDHRNVGINNSEFVNYSYYDQGDISGRLIEVHDGTRIFEEYHYENDKLARREFVINMGHKGLINLQSSILYYDKDYLKDYYFNEVAKEKK